MALSKTMEMVSPSVTASSMPSESRSCSIELGAASGVILFRMPLMARVVTCARRPTSRGSTRAQP